MSELSGRSSSLASVDRVESIGAYLAEQRRMRGISPEQLAEITRIPLRSIERLEAGVFDDNLDGFARGFVRTLALALGLDPQETLIRTLREPSAEETRASGAGRAWARRLAMVALAGLLVCGGVLAREGLLALSKSPSSLPGTVYRRDPVRDLAEAGAPYVGLETAVEAPVSGPPQHANSLAAEIGDLGR